MAPTTSANSDTTYLVCQSQPDAVLLSRLIGSTDEPHDIRVLAASDSSAATSLARTLLTTGPARVAVALGAHVRDPIVGDVDVALAAVARRSRWGIFVFDPAVEVLLAADPAAVAAVLRRPLSDVDRVRLAVEPAAFFRAAAAERNESHVALVAQLARRVDADKVREHAVFQTLFAFVSPAAVPAFAQAV